MRSDYSDSQYPLESHLDWNNHIIGISAFQDSFQIIMYNGNKSNFDDSELNG
jgi:hypothetical protein